MKRIISLILLGLFFFLIGTNLLHAADTTLVSQWGIAPYHGSGFHLNVSVAGDTSNLYGTNLNGWESVRGAFYSPLVGNTSSNGAIVVTGKITFIGEGPDTWSSLRYGVFNNLVPGTLQYAGTDSVKWSGMSNTSYGYLFMPQNGTDYVGNIPGGMNASQGITLNGSWLSSYGGIGFGGGLIQQAPARANMTAGTYDFAFSFHPLSDGTKRVNFYLVKEGTPTPYWYGGSYVVPDTASMMRTDTLSAIIFGVEKLPNMTNMAVSNVHATLGSDITVPVAPFQAFYLDQWGMFGRTGGWHFVVDPDTIIGNAGIAGSKVPSGNWATIRGGFTVPVTATPSKAVIVTGDIQFVGSGPVTWSGLRYGLFNVDSASSVQYALTDSANWGSIQNKGTDSAKFVAGKENSHGYMFTPQSGTTYTGNLPSFGNGGASQGVTNGGSWISTYGGATGFGGLIEQAPARATFSAGSYKFAFSVQPQSDGSNEVRFYMYKDSSKVTYWYGGILNDPSHTTDTFNSVIFGLDPNYDQTLSPISSMILTNVKVDLGNPINVPAPPWQNYYVSDWGIYQGQMGGWTFAPGDLIGNAGISGTKALSGLAEIRGGFSGSVGPRNGVDSALVITGDLELDGGGFQSPGSLRFGLFNNANPGSVKVISDTVGGVVFDSTHWVGSNATESGYLFIPTSGTNNPPVWGVTQGTWGSVINGTWDSTNAGYSLGNDPTIPANAVGAAGNYSFSISVAPAGNGTQEIAYQLKKSDNSYMIKGAAIDNHNILPTTTFNGIVFALGAGNTTTALKLANVQVTLGKPNIITGVAKNPDASLPTAYSLSQNYPNPFNPTTTIDFALPKSGNVKLGVYDILGREITMLVNGNLTAGNHSVNFNALNLASGIYFYKLQAGNFVSVKKLVLLK
ncbi:MAG: T9SS type A sorting domain-containing protein [Ignavibacteriaceae bacterium]